MAWLSGWSYRKEITITGQSGAGTNYQVELEIGDSAGGDFHLEGHCTNFSQDVAITDNDGTTLLDFWIEDLTADPIKMWVEVADDLGSNQTIYVYYGKSGATTNSNISNTFLLGDEFPGSSLDEVTNWDKSGTITVDSSEVTINEDDSIKSKSTFGYGHAVRCLAKADEQDSVFVKFSDDFSVGTGNCLEIYNSDYSNSNNFDSVSCSKVLTGTPTVNLIDDQLDFRNTYRTYEITRTSTAAKYYQDGNLVHTDDNSGNWPTASISVGANTWDSSQASILTIDWILVRKFIATEPTFSSAGIEETAPITGHPWFYERKQ